jgi:hypothetical protein
MRTGESHVIAMIDHDRENQPRPQFSGFDLLCIGQAISL